MFPPAGRHELLAYLNFRSAPGSIRTAYAAEFILDNRFFREQRNRAGRGIRNQQGLDHSRCNRISLLIRRRVLRHIPEKPHLLPAPHRKPPTYHAEFRRQFRSVDPAIDPMWVAVDDWYRTIDTATAKAVAEGFTFPAGAA
jgi:hypothetical protein